VLVAVGWLLASAVVEFSLGWYLPVAGQSLAAPMVGVLVCGLCFIGLGVPFGAWWMARHHKSGGVRWLTLVTLVIGGMVVVVLVGTWTFFWSLPSRVWWDSGQLTTLVQRAEASPQDKTTGCLVSTVAFPAVPGLGHPDSVCASGGEVAFARGAGDHAYGLVYLAPTDGSENGVAPVGEELAGEYGCVQQLHGGWWAFNSAGMMTPGGIDVGCPFGVGW
jgi:hypothetical protein